MGVSSVRAFVSSYKLCQRVRFCELSIRAFSSRKSFSLASASLCRLRRLRRALERGWIVVAVVALPIAACGGLTARQCLAFRRLNTWSWFFSIKWMGLIGLDGQIGLAPVVVRMFWLARNFWKLIRLGVNCAELFTSRSVVR